MSLISKLLLMSITFGWLIPASAFADGGIPQELKDVAYVHQPNTQHFTAGQPDDQQYQAFAEHGVRHVVDLRPPAEASDVNNAARVSAAGMAYYHIPIAGGEDLTPQHVQTLDTILQRIGEEPALLHCASANRVGALISLHAVWHQNMATEDAIALGHAYGLTSLEPHVRRAIDEH